jgi:Integrase core domain
MIRLLCFALAVLASPFKSKLRLEAENAVLRHPLIVLRRRLHGRVRLTNNDRWFFIPLYRWFPSILQVLTIIRPETLVRWHRAGFRCYWRWKSRPLGGRPQIETKLRALIRRMSMENPLWGAPRIHGELLKLGFEVAQSSVAKYMVKRRGPPSQGWRTFLRNHAPDKPTAPASPWQNGFVERLIGSIRRECVDHIIVLGEMHLRRVLKSYADYYNCVRTHRSLNKDAPVSRPVQRTGVISSRAILDGLHHRYARV